MINWFTKKYKWLLTMIMVISVCTACGKSQEEYITADTVEKIIQIDEGSVTGEKEIVETLEESAMEKSETVQTEEETATASSEEEKKEVKRDVDFEIIRESYHYNEQRNDINIYYPQLMGLEDKAKEERINALIETEAKKLIGQKNKEGDDILYCLDLDYEVKFLNNRVISIFYEGTRIDFMPGDANMKEKAMATTIDLEEEKVIALKDVADISKLGDMLLSDEFENITMWEGEVSEFAASTVICIHDEGMDVDLKERHQWYTDGDNFIIVLVDTKLYDYLEYSIDIESVKHILDETFIQKLQ